MKDGTFTADRLLALYERVAEAEDAIPRLRRFVLDLAVRGKLVGQDPSDEPAAELLKRLGKGRVAAPDMPTNWLSAKLCEIIDLQYGKGLDKKLRLDEGPVPVFGSNGIVCFTEEPLTKRPSIIVGRKGSAGALNICDGPSWTTDVAYFVEVPSFLTLRYLFNLLSSLGLDGLGKGVKPGLSRSDAYALSVSLPPLAEQQRIVAKVDELMALCDRLEGARAGREAVRDRLTAATLARLTAPETDTEALPAEMATALASGNATINSTFPNHARFALQTLPTLTTRPDQIKTLRQTILNLAVRGKLVDQDAGDEPASMLLKSIGPEIVRRRQEMGLRRQEPLQPVNLDDEPFQLPLGWTWARFPEVGVFARGKSKHRPRNDTALYLGGDIPFVQTGDVARSSGQIETYSSSYNAKGLEQSMLWPAGTMCITIAANIADSGILTFDACFPDSVVGLLVASPFPNARFFEYFVRTAKVNLTEFAPATAQKNINLGILETVLIPLPPLAEQHRIVAKVDALMALCDQLGASLTSTTTTRSRLLKALLHEALEPVAVGMEAVP